MKNTDEGLIEGSKSNAFSYPDDRQNGFEKLGSSVTRRKFLKRTGGATASAFIAAMSARRAEGRVGDKVSVSGSSGTLIQAKYCLHCKAVPEILDHVTTWLVDPTEENNEEMIHPQQELFRARAWGPNTGELAPELRSINGQVTIYLWDGDKKNFSMAKTPCLFKDGLPYSGEWLHQADSPPRPMMLGGGQVLPSDEGMAVGVNGTSVAASFSRAAFILSSLSMHHARAEDRTEHWQSNVEGGEAAANEKEAVNQSEVNATTGAGFKLKQGVKLESKLAATRKKNFSARSSLSQKRDYQVTSGSEGQNNSEYRLTKTYDTSVWGEINFHWVIRVLKKTRTIDLAKQEVVAESSWEEISDASWPDDFRIDSPDAEPEE
jgi:hypothetical protein